MRSLTVSSIFAVFAVFAVFATFTFQCPKAFAHAHHTANFCSMTAPDICAHLGFEVEPNSTDELIFMLDFAPSKNDPALITNVTVKLNMDMPGMQHGARSVTIVPADAAHYEVSKAYFSMPGQWQVKVGFTYNGAVHEVIVLVDVR